MKKQIKPFAILIFIILAATTIKAQKINIEAALKYWELTDSLRQNKPISDEPWKNFINLEGNKAYAYSEFDSISLSNYRKALEIVYMPKSEALMQRYIKANYWYTILIKRYKDQEDSLKTYLSETVQKPAYKDLMYKYVYEYLPKRYRTKSDVTFYYNALGMDAVSQSDGIFISLMTAVNSAKIKTGILEAHELHHRLRKLLNMKDARNMDEGILYALISIQNEGMADMIDKKVTYSVPGDPEGVREWLLDPAPAAIKSLDSAVTLTATDSSGSQSSKFYRKVLKYSAGHMPGFYMARIIERNGYKKQMIEQCDNPFSFIIFYNKAAQKDKEHPPVLSDVTMAYLKNLEQYYLH